MSIVFRPHSSHPPQTDPAPRTASRSLLAPTLLGTAPLTAGSIAFFGYLITREFEFAYFGLTLLPFGTFAVFIGLSLLCARDLRDHPSRRAVFWLLLANIPAAMVYAAVGMALVSADLAPID